MNTKPDYQTRMWFKYTAAIILMMALFFFVTGVMSNPFTLVIFAVPLMCILPFAIWGIAKLMSSANNDSLLYREQLRINSVTETVSPDKH